ncbi:LppM family (lipo)protein [Aeromicrobium sp. 179-A 4D2 NHS]|uniref:LppM family (lipo)protein n=1 Tax=Aeromicrobium sp. 179-A 4D2 NHS TaxID=3142375 RepID=UPI00399FD070
MKKPLLLVVTTLMALLMLSGCYRMDMSMKFNADDTVDGHLAVGIKEDALDALISMSGEDEDAFWGEMSKEMQSDDENGVFSDAKVSNWKEGDYKGRKFSFEGATINNLNDNDEDNSKVTHADGKFTVVLDTSDMAVSDEDDDFAMTGSPILRMEFEFPGKVTSAPGGAIDGNKVVYLFDSKDELKAIPATLTITALDKGEGGSNTAVLLVVGLLIVAGGAVGVALVAKSGKRDQSDVPGDPGVDGAPRESRVSPFATDEGDDLAPGAGDEDDWDQYDRP